MPTVRPLRNSLTEKTFRRLLFAPKGSTEKTQISFVVQVSFEHLMSQEISGEALADEYCSYGASYLMELEYRIVGMDERKQLVLIEITGDATEILKAYQEQEAADEDARRLAKSHGESPRQRKAGRARGRPRV